MLVYPLLSYGQCHNCNVLAHVLGILLMERYGMQFHSENAQIWCLAHAVNIVVQTLLKQLNEAEDPDILNWFDANKHLLIHYDVDNDEDVKAMEAEDLVEAEDGSTELDNILKDELPKNTASMSVVKKISCFAHTLPNAGSQPLITLIAAPSHCQQDCCIAAVASAFQTVHEEALQ
jgi:hypothetical protein